MANKHKKHYFLIKISGKKTIRLGVKVRDAKSPVVISRTMADVMAGAEGLSVTCANAVCALRQDGETIGHPVYMAEFTDNRAYLVDRLDRRGAPSSCVRYAHNEGKFQKQFDTKRKGMLAKMSGIEKHVVLSPPPATIPKGLGTSPYRGHSGTPGATRERKRQVLAKGAIARALRAGINLGVT